MCLTEQPLLLLLFMMQKLIYITARSIKEIVHQQPQHMLGDKCSHALIDVEAVGVL